MLDINETTDFSSGQFLLVDKPYRWTSFDLVKKVMVALKKTYQYDKLKVGHAGTLDPLATGLLLICTGRYTKQAESLQASEKEYIATVALGKTTPSFDLETEVDATFPVEHITRELVENCLTTFLGETDQVPPVFSAKSVNGKRAYKYARRGEMIEMQPNKVTIKEIELVEFSQESIIIRVVCSKGTYIRSLARDIGLALNSGGHLSALRRTAVGNYKIEEAISLDSLLDTLNNVRSKIMAA
jgi:tRNA pseudouridine55 synthase